MFFPPDQGEGDQIFSTRWGTWQQPGQEQSQVTWWRSDADLLAQVDSGDALPLNDLRTYRIRALEGLTADDPGTALARLGDDRPLLVRAPADRGAAYFCTTLPTARCSSLERDGVVFYVMLQRALADGCRSLAVTSLRDAGPGVLDDRTQWKPVATAEDDPGVSQREFHAGVYKDGDYWTALNRSLAEDRAPVTPVASVDALFAGLAYDLIDDAVGDPGSLTSEIWGLFLLAMALALVAEAGLCMPERKIQHSGFGDLSRVKREAL